MQEGFIPEIEQEVIGSLLLAGDPKLVFGRVREEHFIEPIHRAIFSNMIVADQRYKSAGVGIVFNLFSKEQVDEWGRLLGINLSAYLARLAANCVRGPAGLRDSVHSLLQQWARLKIVDEAARLSAAAADPSSDPNEIIRGATRALDDVSSSLRGGASGRTRFSLAEAASCALIEVEEAMERGNGLTGVTWGLTDVNAVTGGLQRGEMTVLGARPSMGKTATALSIGIRGARSGAGVGFISLEMGSTKLALRAMTDIAYDWNVKVPYSDLITGKVSPSDLEAIKSANRDLENLPLWIEEQPGLSVSDLRVKLERMMDVAERSGSPLNLLIVDYLQLIHPSSRYQGNRTAEITEISAALRNIAREYGLAVLALSQLSRNVESRPIHDRRPTLSDLRESGSIEQDADTVIFLFREAYYLAKEKGKDPDAETDRLERLIECQNKLEFIIAKQRNGPVKTIDLFIDIACSAVRNASRFQ